MPSLPDNYGISFIEYLLLEKKNQGNEQSKMVTVVKISMKVGIISVPSVWLYGENRKDVIDELFMGWAVGIIEEACGWCKVVTHYGYKGYLRKECLFESPDGSKKTFQTCTQEELYRRDFCRQTAFIRSPFADVMEEPTVHSRILMSLNKGSFVTILSEVRNGYTKICLANGQTGWIPNIFYEWRKENDGYLYDKEPETYFLRQKNVDFREVLYAYPFQSHSETKEMPFMSFGESRKILLEHPTMLCDRRREMLVSWALTYRGTGYRWAGKSAAGIDCSGFTFMCYLMCGILIYRDAEIKEGYPIFEIPVESAEPGDLLYFPGHIAMYLGNQKYIHATGNEKSFGCVINSLSKEDADYREDLAETLYAAGSFL